MCNCNCQPEMIPIAVPAGTPLPFDFPIIQSIGQWPIISVEYKLAPDADGTPYDDAPNITVRRWRNDKNYITKLSLLAADGGGVTLDDLIIVIHPQNVLTV